MKPILFLLLAFSLTVNVSGEEHPAFTLEHTHTTEYRNSSADGNECILTFTLIGQRIDEALEAGHWQIESATDDTGSPLSALPAYEKKYAALKKRPIAVAPGAVATVQLGITAAPRSARMIQTLSGSLGINVFRRQVVIIDDLNKNLNTQIENPLFKAHGFTVQVIDPQHAYPGYSNESEKNALLSRAIALRIEGDINKVDSFKLVGPDGNELPSRPAGFGAGRSRTMARMADTALPAGTTAHLLIPIDPKEIRIPFSFTDIPLP